MKTVGDIRLKAVFPHLIPAYARAGPYIENVAIILEALEQFPNAWAEPSVPGDYCVVAVEEDVQWLVSLWQQSEPL